MSKHRNWVFTLNNYNQDELDTLRQLHSRGGFKYIAFQPEQGESETKHLQGVLVCTNPRALNGLRTLLGRAHWEPMRGTLQQARDYCSKEETRDANAGFGFSEFGDIPAGAGEPGARTDLSAVVQNVKLGKSAKQIFETDGETFVKYFKGIERAIGFYEPRRDFKTTVHWFYGATGTGKTRTAFELAPLAYFKSPANHWWDGYEGQEEVIVDDYRADFCKFSQLLRLFDRYPLSVEVKGGTRQFLARHIYITCPKHPREMWNNRTDEDIAQLMRRIEDIRNFNDPILAPIFNNFAPNFNPPRQIIDLLEEGLSSPDTN